MAPQLTRAAYFNVMQLGEAATVFALHCSTNFGRAHVPMVTFLTRQLQRPLLYFTAGISGSAQRNPDSETPAVAYMELVSCGQNTTQRIFLISSFLGKTDHILTSGLPSSSQSRESPL